MERGNKKNFLIGTLVAIILFMAVGYAAFASALSISGSTSITGSWGVEFTNLTNSKIGGAKEEKEATYDATSVLFNVELNAPGDKMTYTITVKNTGTIDAKLKSIISSDLNGTDPIIYTITGIKDGDTLKAGESTTFNVIIEYVYSSELSEEIFTKQLSLSLNFEQAA